MDSTPSVTHIGLCAGYGGIELGLKRAIPGLRTIALCEIEAFAISNLVAKMEAGLMDPAPIWPDLKTFPWAAFRDRVDILTGGYPCQPFSAAGQRKGKQDPRHLWPWIADGIRLLRPRCCFFENVEGHISLGLSDVIEDLAGMGYRTTWGIFSASECGAPHQRKRVFIMAHNDSERSQELARQVSAQSNTPPLGTFVLLANSSSQRSSSGLSGQESRYERKPGITQHGCREAWPSRPGEQQYAWEPPRVVADSYRVDRSAQAEGWQHDRQTGSAGEELGDATSTGSWSEGGDIVHQERRSCISGTTSIPENTQRENGAAIPDNQSTGGDGGEELADASISGSDRRPDGTSGRSREPGETGEDAAGCGGESNGMRQIESTLGLHVDECSGVLGQTLTLNPHGDNVDADENISKKARARQVLFKVWQQARTKGVRWETGRLQCFFEEKVLQSGVQLDGFTQRICFFVWCLQTGHQAQGWGLRGMHIYESSRGSSQGQEPIEQLKRELGYAMCQLSYEIALERGENLVETEGIMQGVRESSERAWALSQALPEMEEVWRSTLDQTVWENGCFVEAASKGNRTDELRLLGNGVVPATAEQAFRSLMRELDTTQARR